MLQDLTQTLNQVSVIEGIQAQAHDFFTPQPIKGKSSLVCLSCSLQAICLSSFYRHNNLPVPLGAKFYYLRRVLHDWPDADALKIIQKLALVLSSESRILIDEIMMPDQSAPWHSTMIDLSMMMAFAGKERPVQQWRDLAAQSGLCVEGIHTCDQASYAPVIIMIPCEKE